MKWQRGTVQLILLTTNASFGWSIKEIKVVQQNLSSYYRETYLMQQFSLGFLRICSSKLSRTIDNTIVLIFLWTLKEGLIFLHFGWGWIKWLDISLHSKIILILILILWKRDGQICLEIGSQVCMEMFDQIEPKQTVSLTSSRLRIGWAGQAITKPMMEKPN